MKKSETFIGSLKIDKIMYQRFPERSLILMKMKKPGLRGSLDYHGSRIPGSCKKLALLLMQLCFREVLLLNGLPSV
jgi:hypothetical protein